MSMTTWDDITCVRPGCNEPRAENGVLCREHTDSAMNVVNGSGTMPRVPRSVEFFKQEEANRREALRQLAEAEAGAVEFPALISLPDLLAMPDEPVKYRIKDLLVIGHRVILAAAKKTGKTTMMINFVRSIVDGTPFLGRYEVTPLEEGESVVVFDLEMSVMQLRTWLKDAGVRNADRVHAVPLRGQLAAFRIMDDKIRDHWAEQLRAVNAKVGIIDPFNPVLSAHNADENSNSEVSRVLAAFDQLAMDGGLSELMITHHMGHNGERSRGASKIGDWPDAEWKMAWGDNPEGGRSVFFSAFGRDVFAPEAMLFFEPKDRRLTIDCDAFGRILSRNDIKDQAKRDAVIQAITDNPGAVTRDIRAASGLSGADFKAATSALISSGKIYTTPGKGNAQHWHLGPKPESPFKTEGETAG